MSRWKLSGYVVEELLGFGGSGQVWRARVACSGAPVALKRIPIGDAAQLRAAQAEAALLTTLDHPHLIRLHELVRTSDGLVLVLDLAAGGTLAALIDARGRVTPGEVVTALAPIGSALAYAHGAGVVHGDVTPSNVLFTETGMPLLADLGVARLLGDHAAAHSTPAFIDPAVAAGCVPAPRSDVFMLGAVALHALTGRPVWRGDTPAEVLASAAAGESGEIEALLAAVDVPEAMRAVLSRALSVEPSRRGSAADFALDLRYAQAPMGIELSAGRMRGVPAAPTPIRALAAGHSGAAGVASTGVTVADPGRPAFDRPGGAEPKADSPVLTHLARPRPRPLPAHRAHRVTRGRVPGSWVAVAGAAMAIAAGLVWSALGGGGSSKPAAADTHTIAPVGVHPPIATVSPSTRTTTSSSTHRPDSLDASVVSKALAHLDELRQRAFADRDASVLRQVYVPGPLLIQDTAVLTRLVPAGCRLIGVQTGYDHVRVTAHAGSRVETEVNATLTPSVLACGGNATGRAAGSGPSALHITLVQQGSGYLIAAIGR